MTDHDDHFGEFAPHTRLKHFILKTYLEVWALKLLKSGKFGTQVWFLDGFAGAGQDSKRNPGSPLIAARTAATVRGIFATSTQRLGLFCIESDPLYFESLEAVLVELRKQDPSRHITKRGLFSDHYEEALRTIAGAPVFAFLDPFGVKGLDARTYPPLLASPGSEIFVLFSDSGAIRVRGSYHADDAKLRGVLAGMETTLGLFPELDAADQRALRGEISRREAKRASDAPKNREALSNAIGDSSWTDELRHATTQEARDAIIQRFLRTLQLAGARFLTVIPVRDEDGIHKHLLVHATKSEAGVLAMKEQVCRALNAEELNEAVRANLREDLTLPIGLMADLVCGLCENEERPWAREAAGSVQRELLTGPLGVFQFQMADLAAELRKRKWLTTKGKHIVRRP